MNPRLKMRMSPDQSPGLSRPVQGGLYVAALILIPLLAIGGSDSFRAALDFTTGVLSLVSLTASVAWGLIATDRLLLSPATACSRRAFTAPPRSPRSASCCCTAP